MTAEPELPANVSALPVRPLPPHNLPTPPTPLIDREQEVAQACDLLLRADARVLTLTGPGGVGKTRLALAVASGLREVFDAGVWFVSLATITDPDLVAGAIAQSLGAREEQG
jgi:hypothetical protein